MAARAELKARLTLDKSLFDRGIAQAQHNATQFATGLVAATRLGTRAFAALGVAAAGIGAGLAIGVKKAFDLGGHLADVSNLSGRSARDILIMKRALEDAGVSAEKIDQYLLTGRDRGNVIQRVLGSLSAKDWRDAAASVGEQANILNRNVAIFDRTSDLLNRAGDKLQGFFVGVADRLGAHLLPLLERFDKMDFSKLGQSLGNNLVKGAFVLTGMFENPQLLLDTFFKYFRAGILGIGNVLIAVFKSGVEFLKDDMFQVAAAIGSAITATLIEAFQRLIAFLQAGIEAAAAKLPKALGGTDEKGDAHQRILQLTQQLESLDRQDERLSASHADPESLRKTGAIRRQVEQEREYQRKISAGGVSVADRAGRIMSGGGPEFGLFGGMTAEQWRNQASQTANAGISKAAQAFSNFKVQDVLGAGTAFQSANANLQPAASRGAAILQNRISPMDFTYGGYTFPKGSALPPGVLPPGGSPYQYPTAPPPPAAANSGLSELTTVARSLVTELQQLNQ